MDLQQAKENMIQGQLRPFGVTDVAILNSFYDVPRELFVQECYADLAYSDIAFPATADSPSMLMPQQLGYVLQSLLKVPPASVLLIGANGYLAALLSQLVPTVTVVSTDDSALQSMQGLMSVLNIQNVTHICCDIAHHDKDTVYDIVFVDGSMPWVPQWLRALVAVGGRLFVVEGQPPIMQAMLYRRCLQDKWEQHALFETIQTRASMAAQMDAFQF